MEIDKLPSADMCWVLLRQLDFAHVICQSQPVV